MDRKDRHMSQRLSRARHAERDSAAIEKALSGIGIPDSQKDTFLRWAMGSLWKDFTELRMNQRLIIENEIRNLGLRFPNGTVKKEYSYSFQLPVDKIDVIELTGLDELGLTLEMGKAGEFFLYGKPQKSGDFTLKLRYATVEGEPVSELSIPIAFNPNPRTIWKNIDTHEATTRFYKPDYDSEYIGVKMIDSDSHRKDIVAASQRGRSHAHEGRPRDDHYSIFHCDDSDWYIIAVADGAGSAKYSRRGSELACQTVVNHCRNLLLDNTDFEKIICDYQKDRENKQKRTAVTRYVIDIIYKGAVKAHEELKKEAFKEEIRLKDLATTLMFAICKKYDFGWFIASFWVGDGAMCLFDADNKTAKLLGTPDEGEFSGQTRFLTMPEIFRDPDVVSKRLRMAIVPDFTALFLMTDGVSDPMFETERNLNDYAKWEEFYNNLKNGFPEDEVGGVDLSDDNEKAAEQLLGWLDFWSPGNHDDRTIAILY